MRSAVVLALLLLGCRQTVPLDAQLALGPSIRVANLEVWPVLANTTEDVGPVLTLEQAQKQGTVAIRELESAQVASLAIENKGDTRILACAGTVVTGGKQDRQLGEDIVIDAQTTVVVKAFCVEAGRWNGDDSFEGTSQKTAAPVRAAGQYELSQRQVWHGVEIAQAAAIGDGDSYRLVQETAHRRQADAAKIEKHLRSQGKNVVGYAYAIDGDAAGIRTFAHRALLEPRLQGFVQAMCVEAELRGSGMTVFVPPQITQVGVDDGPGQEIALVPSAYRAPGADPLREASDAYDRGDYARAEAKAKEVPVGDPRHETAVELARLARESRYVADREQQFDAEWKTLMEEIQSAALAQPSTPPRAAARPRKPIDIPTLFRKLNAKPEEISETEGANRNGYRRAEEGNHSTCYVKTKDGRWVPLTRDWTAR